MHIGTITKDLLQKRQRCCKNLTSERKLTLTLLSTFFWIVTTHSVCHWSLLAWRKFAKRWANLLPSLTYHGSTLFRYRRNTTTTMNTSSLIVMSKSIKRCWTKCVVARRTGDGWCVIAMVKLSPWLCRNKTHYLLTSTLPSDWRTPQKLNKLEEGKYSTSSTYIWRFYPNPLAIAEKSKALS